MGKKLPFLWPKNKPRNISIALLTDVSAVKNNTIVPFLRLLLTGLLVNTKYNIPQYKAVSTKPIVFQNVCVFFRNI